MINKVYDKIKEYIKENKGFLLTIAIICILSYITFPVYINAPGGLVNLDKKVVIKDEYKSSGSFNMAYVSEYRANVFMLLIAYINPNWDIYSKEEYVSDGESIADMLYRNKLEMKEAVDNAIILGYQKANKNVEITNTKTYITYVDKNADTDLVIKDQVLKVNGTSVQSRQDINKIINGEAGTKYEIEVINDGKQYTRYATLRDWGGFVKIGIILDEDKEYNVNPDVKFKFKSNESGPSGGLMTTLEIYNSLTDDDLTKGYKIVGTGTIDMEGNVGMIGGVKYKLKGAIKKKADIFLVPDGENYEEAIKIKNENNYDIEIVSISTFDEALNYLTKLPLKTK